MLLINSGIYHTQIHLPQFIPTINLFYFIIEYRVNLTTMDQLNVVTKTIDNTMQRVILANLTLENLKAKAVNLKETALSLKNNSTQLQERNVEGKNNVIFKNSYCLYMDTL